MIEQQNLQRDVAPVVLAYQGEAWVEACLRSLLEAGIPEKRIYVVDNGSTDDTCRIATSLFPDVVLIRNDQNLGFAAGCNRGIQRALDDGAAYVALFNQDLRVAPNCFEHLRTALAEQPAGVYALLQLTYDGSALDPSMRTSILPRAEGFLDDLWHGSVKPSYPIPVAYGGAMVIHHSVFNRVGLFDECYFLYGEDEDFCRRARGLGVGLWLVPAATVSHWHTLVQKEGLSKTKRCYARHARTIHALKDLRRPWGSRCLSVAASVSSEIAHALARRDWVALRDAFGDVLWVTRNLRRIKRSRDADIQRLSTAVTPGYSPNMPRTT